MRNQAPIPAETWRQKELSERAVGQHAFADQVHAVRDTQAAVTRKRRRIDPDRFQAEPFEPEGPPQGDHDPLPFHVAAIAELNHVGILLACSRTDAHGTFSQPELDAIVAQDSGDCLGVAGMISLEQSRVGMNHCDLHAEAREHGGHLHARGATAQHHEAARQVPGRRRLAAGPWVGVRKTLDRWHLGLRSGRDDDRPRGKLLRGASRGRAARVDSGHDLHEPRPGDAGSATVYVRPDGFELLDVTRVVGPVAPLAIDHVVATVRGALPRISTVAMLVGGVKQRLRWDARPERARTAE